MRARTAAEKRHDRRLWTIALSAGVVTAGLAVAGLYSPIEHLFALPPILAFLATLPPLVVLGILWWFMGRVVNAPIPASISMLHLFHILQFRIIWASIGGGLLIATGFAWWRVACGQ